MKTYTVEDPQTGKRVKFQWEGGVPPTDIDIDQIFQEVRTSAPAPQPQPKGFAGRVGERLGERYQAVAEEPLTVQSVATLRQPLRVAGQVAGGLTDIIGETLKSGYGLLPEVVQAGIRGAGKAMVEGMPKVNVTMQGIQGLMGQWSEFREKHPEPAKDIEAAGNIAMVAPILKPLGQLGKEGIAVSKDIMKLSRKGVEKAATGAKDVVATTRNVYDKLRGVYPDAALEPIKNNAIRGVVEKGLEKGIRPTVTGKATYGQIQSYFNRGTEAVKSIVQNKQALQFTDEAGNIVRGELPKSLHQFSQAVEQTKKTIFQTYDELAKAAGQQGAVVDLRPIVAQIDDITSKAALQDLSPATVKYAQNRAKALLKRGTYTAEEAQEAIKILNNSLESFYKNPTYGTGQKAVVDAMIANNLRSSLDDVITQAVGPGYQDLKASYGALKSIEKEVAHRAIVDLRKNVKGLLDFTQLYSGTQAVTGLLTMNPKLMIQAGTIESIARYLKMMNNPNRHIRKMFENVDELMKISNEGPKSKIGQMIVGGRQ